MPVSESVWFEQVDVGLIEYIQNAVKMPDKNGVYVAIPVKVRKPDEDFKIETYPSITIYNLYSKRDNIRYYRELSVVDKDFEKYTITMEKPAIPYTLTYQIDFWSKTNAEMNDMLRLWLSYVDFDFNLPVKDMAGNSRDCLVQLMDKVAKTDNFSGTKRTFHTALTYKIWVELDEKLQVVKPLITEVHPSVRREN